MSFQKTEYSYEQIREWKMLRQMDLAFLAAVKRGIPILQAFRSSGRNRKNQTAEQALACCSRLLRRYPNAAKPILDRKERKEAARMLVELKAQSHLLDSEKVEDQERGSKALRALHGLDEPAKTHAVIEAPGVQDSPDFTPASQRFAGEN